MERPALLAAAAATLGAAWMLATRHTEEEAPAGAEDQPNMLEGVTDMVNRVFQRWRPPAAYAGLIAAAEARNGIPPDMLARLLWQECRWRPDVIDGTTRSPRGALGMAQFMPATAEEWGVNPLEPASAIDGAARYLAWLYRRTGSWTQALAAYNWGLGNVQRRGLAAAPAETRAYFAGILADVNAANGTAWA